MMKMRKMALIDVFTGWQNRRARDIADSMGNRSADAYSISLVQQTLGKLQGLKGVFELAANAYRAFKIGGTTGRPYKPTFAFPAPHPEPR